MNSLKTRYFKKLRKKEYRDALVEAAIGDTIAVQLQKLREKSGLKQSELASIANMAQPRIAVLENPGYDKYTVNTLKRLASALDVGLIIRFVPFGEVVDWVTQFSPKAIEIPSFEEEYGAMQSGAIYSMEYFSSAFDLQKQGQRKTDLKSLLGNDLSGSFPLDKRQPQQREMTL